MKCANCDKDAIFIYRITKLTSVYYCSKDLPGFLEGRRIAGQLSITEEFTEQKESALKILSSPEPIKKRVTKKSEE